MPALYIPDIWLETCGRYYLYDIGFLTVAICLCRARFQWKLNLWKVSWCLADKLFQQKPVSLNPHNTRNQRSKNWSTNKPVSMETRNSYSNCSSLLVMFKYMHKSIPDALPFLLNGWPGITKDTHLSRYSNWLFLYSCCGCVQCITMCLSSFDYGYRYHSCINPWRRNSQWTYNEYTADLSVGLRDSSSVAVCCHTYMFFQFQFDWRVHFIPWNIHLNLNFFNSLCLQSRNASLYF